MRSVCMVIAGFVCGLALSQYLMAPCAVTPAGDVLVDHGLSLHEHGLASACESTVSESEEETAVTFDVASQNEFSAPLVAAHRGFRQHSSPRELLHTLHRLQI